MPALLQRLIALLGGIALAPFLGVLAALIRLESPGPAIFRATRVGRGGRPFTCYKLRTMHWRPADSGPGVSVDHDPRITRLGRVIRRTRLDELPQLWNVVRGEMLLVGPRPEDPRFVDLADPIHQCVFTATPGITGPTQLAFADEAALLSGADPETIYRQVVLPAKLRLDERYLARRSLLLDCWVLARTITSVAGHRPDPATIEARLA